MLQIVACWLVLQAPTAEPPLPFPKIALESIGRLEHEAIREASGLVASRKYPGVFWVLNDSENPNTIFAVNRDGSLIREFRVDALNIDWEDIATDNRGHLYLADIGNNKNRLPRRAVHEIDEPDPKINPERPLKVLRSWYYEFPKEGRFDAEGLFVRDGKILITEKTFEGRDAAVYELSMSDKATFLKPVQPKKVATLPGFNECVTGACLSADGRFLVVCSYRSLGVYEADGANAWKRVTIRSFRVSDQIEAVCWEKSDILLAGEDRGVYRVAESAWRHDASASAASSR